MDDNANTGAAQGLPEFAELVEVRHFSMKLLKIGDSGYALAIDTLYGRRYAFLMDDRARDSLASMLTQAKIGV